MTREIPVLCRFWCEDSVWNAFAHDLPVAVYGQTIEEAWKNLGDGLICYFESLLKLERFYAVAEKLERLAQERLLPMTEMPADEFFLKTMAMLSDHKVTTHELCKTDRPADACPAEVRQFELRPREVRPAEVRNFKSARSRRAALRSVPLML